MSFPGGDILWEGRRISRRRTSGVKETGKTVYGKDYLIDSQREQMCRPHVFIRLFEHISLNGSICPMFVRKKVIKKKKIFRNTFPGRNIARVFIYKRKKGDVLNLKKSNTRHLIFLRLKILKGCLRSKTVSIEIKDSIDWNQRQYRLKSKTVSIEIKDSIDWNQRQYRLKSKLMWFGAKSCLLTDFFTIFQRVANFCTLPPVQFTFCIMQVIVLCNRFWLWDALFHLFHRLF